MQARSMFFRRRLDDLTTALVPIQELIKRWDSEREFLRQYRTYFKLL